VTLNFTETVALLLQFSSVLLPRAPPSLFIVVEGPLYSAWVAFRQLKKVPGGSGNKQDYNNCIH